MTKKEFQQLTKALGDCQVKILNSIEKHNKAVREIAMNETAKLYKKIKKITNQE